MLGTFSEQALSDYAEKVRAKTKRVQASQGTEYADNLGVGEHDHGYLDTDESQDKQDYSEYDFTVCVRDNGTVYGTRGKCRLGKETSEDQAALLRASNRKRSRGTLGGSLKQRVARDPDATQLAKQLKDLGSERDNARKRLSAAAANLAKNKGQEEARLKYREAQSEANQALTKYERTRTALNRRVRELTVEQKTQNAAPRKKATKDVPDWANVTGSQL